ncbi:MAG: NUDIX domain-containing protein [Legionellaceae bacterium]|nr:NUDIX domain-containing protein [Legionellaceae bacterium]
MTHIHPLYDLTVAAFIVNRNRLLLLFHKKLGSWIHVGGHVELNEDPEMALWREIQEETGLTKDKLQLVNMGQERPVAHGPLAKALPLPFDLSVYLVGNSAVHRHIELSYLITSNTDKVILNPRESTDIGWFNQQDIESMKETMFPNVYGQCLFALQHYL